MPSLALYEVGGCIRDEILGLKTKDIDFCVEVEGFGTYNGFSDQGGLTAAFKYMIDTLTERGYTVFHEEPEKATIRAKFPKGHPLSKLSADFVLCREEGPYLDGRTPSWVRLGTLATDLARRDFTVNAMCRAISDDGRRGEVIDQHDGLWDLSIKRLRFVGDPMDRLRQDGLRVLRAIRFRITKGFVFDQSVRDTLADPIVAKMLSGVSVDRRREELERCFHYDTLGTLDVIDHEISVELRDAMFEGSLRLSATQKRDMVHSPGGRATK